MTVGITRLTGQAGASLDLRAYLAGDLSEREVPVLINALGWTYGTGAGAVNLIYTGKTTLALGGNATLEINGGTLLDVFKRAATFNAIKFVYIKNNSADATLEVLGTAVTALDICKDPSDIILVKPGGCFLWTDPTTAGTVTTANFNLKILHDGTGASTMVVDVIIMGLD